MALLRFLTVVLLGLMTTSYLGSAQEDLNLYEQTILLALRNELAVPGWNLNGSDFCSWHGIGCSQSTVKKLVLSGLWLHKGNLTLISELKSLSWLDLSANNFQGSIPPAFGQLVHLQFLDLSFNIFNNSIPKELGRLQNLRALNLSHNSLSGPIPQELGQLQELEELFISSNRLNGSIPVGLGNLTKLEAFSAYENKFSGFIPENLGLNSDLTLLVLHTNQLEGVIPENLFARKKLKFLVLTQNRLTGYIPQSIGNCKGLWSVRIGENRLMGTVPKEIGNVRNLVYFEANNNNLSGEIVSEFSMCSNLTLLNLASNGLTGTIPREFGLLTNLQELILSGNSLIGEIPLPLLEVKNLNKLDLSNNKFNGTIPKNICSAPGLQYLLLEHNSIEGEIPNEIGNCIKLLELSLGNNQLNGQVPREIGHLTSLQIGLNLSYNHLSGNLPRELGKLNRLVSMDVSNNRLSGRIPSSFIEMMSLIEVNFSNNQFFGQIPAFLPFQKSLNTSFLGNNGLCGNPLNTRCGNLNLHNNVHHYANTLAVIGSVFAIIISVSIVVVLFIVRENQEKAAKAVEERLPMMIAGNVFVENLKEGFDFDEVAKAAMKDGNMLRDGTFSTMYKAELPSGTILAVRKLKSMDTIVLQYQGKIAREIEKLSKKLSHENLMSSVGFAIYEDTVLLLHQHFPDGTLAQFLHESTKRQEYKPDWRTRLSIAIGVAKGLAFLHSMAIIHLDICSSNVLLDSNFKPLVCEVEISRILDPSIDTASITAVAGSFGYIPPEYAYTMQVTPPGNVYSYGVVLLEILTSKLPIDEAFGEGTDLVKMVHGAPERGETPEQILDSRLSTVSFRWRNEMLLALKVALLCTDSTPAKRPRMKKVVEMLQEISDARI
ncbi:unnamed protein product [Cuscuta epithymum]|uniref:non-specific serine/threonine protein kinase n=2 Tax=Cuscuta epithymum TaxID=186058 RepID=A0AAV0EWI8_9ASTE|nr:unnamed protein product [Cuscuta epithymum]